jgi:hypothetical protein
MSRQVARRTMHFQTDGIGMRLMHRGESVARLVRSNGDNMFVVIFADGRNSDAMPLHEAQATARLWGVQTWLKDAPSPNVTPLMSAALKRNSEVREYVSAPDEKSWPDWQPRRRR